jgi:hypothetical protein
MKPKLIFLIALLAGFSSVSVSAQGKIYDRLSGQWQGIDKQQKNGSLNFLDSVRVEISFVANEFIKGNYTLDTTKSPMKLDIKVGNANTSRTLKGLLAFMDNNTLKWQIFLDGKRPAQFVKETDDNTILLKRKE